LAILLHDIGIEGIAVDDIDQKGLRRVLRNVPFIVLSLGINRHKQQRQRDQREGR
jgi:hypothetical protein